MERQQEGDARPGRSEGQDADRRAEWEKLNATLCRIKETIQEAIPTVRGLSASEPSPFQHEAELTEAMRVRESAKECRDSLNQIIMNSTQSILNDALRPIAESRKDEGDYEEKKRLARFVNDSLREQDAVLASPDTKAPSILYAIASYDKAGRYTLEDRLTKKRSGSYKSISDIYPVVTIPDLPRKEGFIEHRRRAGPLHDDESGSQKWQRQVAPSDEQERGNIR